MKKLHTAIFLISCLSFFQGLAQPANNNFASATPLVMNTCSANGAYTTVNATSDLGPGSCWNSAGGSNVWFSFVATTSQVRIDVQTGGAAGTLQYAYGALWASNGTTQLACQTYSAQFSGVTLNQVGLTIGNTYYISVDNYTGGGYQGTFKLCLASAVDYDFYEGAVDVSGLLITGCSADAAYTTVQATPDKNPGSCWNSSGGANRWFSFVATTAQIKIDVQTGGSAGTLQYVHGALWAANGTTQLACQTYSSQFSGVTISQVGLTIGNTYYISVDNYTGAGYQGTFKLCLNPAVDYDFYEGAIDVSGLLVTGCSANAAYTTVQATPDKNPGSCWNSSGGANRWFKFVATTAQVKIDVQTGGILGTLQYVHGALWAANGTTQLACQTYTSQYSGVTISQVGLTIGNTYYISVDNYTGAGYQGTFKLCLNPAVDYDFYEGAVDVSGLLTTGCSADAAYTTVQATPDKNPGSCWNSSGGANRWFKFVATTAQVKIDVQTGGSAGTIQYVHGALWAANGTTQIGCQTYSSQFSGVTISQVGLTIGNTYYISVDNYTGVGYQGTFKLCLNPAVDYDFYEGALDVSGLLTTGCSANAAYSTVQATPDKNPGSCWNSSGGANRWFKFVATTAQIKIDVLTGGILGTVQYVHGALWAANGTTQLACQTYSSQYSGVTISQVGLTIGNTYYISVDNYTGAGYQGTFKLCLNPAVDYDFYEGAMAVTNLINTCSADAAYTTVQATPDKNPGSCWNSSGGANRWFKFVATTAQIKIDLQTGGSAGTLQYMHAALWAANGTTQLACQTYSSQFSGVTINQVGLTIGNTYYISVDNYTGAGYQGTFKLCLSDAVDYDFYEGANNLTNLNNWCSADAAYTTVLATPDKNPGSCWNSAGGANRWFKFVAITNTATIQAKTGGSEGTLQYPYLAIWQANGTTQVACATYASQFSDLSITIATLVVGNTYYISVDNYTGAGYTGTFKLCITNVGPIYFSRQNGPWTDPNSWSNIGYHNATASVSFPGAGDIADIQGNDITVTANQQVAELNLDVSVANTSISVSTGLLTVNGQMTMNNPGNNFSGSILLQANGSLYVNDVLSLSRAGGNQSFGMTVNSGSAATVNIDLNWTSSAGTAVDNLLTVSGTGTVTVNRDVNLTSTGGRLIKLQFNNTSIFTAKRDINFVANAAALESVELNNTAQLKIARNFVRGATPFGTLASNGTSTVEYNGVVYLQNFPASAGSGGDSFTYQNVVINNTHGFVPQITMGGAATVNGNLTMTSGVISSTAANILNLLNASVTTIGSAASYISGPMTYEVATATANTIRNFPIGKSGFYRPAILSVTHTNATSVIYTAEHINSSPTALGYTLPATVDRVSGNRYWQIDRQAVANFTSAIVTLYYDVVDGVTNFPALTVVKNVGAGTTWFDIGGVATANGAGSITSLSFNSFSKFTLGDKNGGTNPLPIELVNFAGHFDGQSVVLKWKTASELQNDYFLIQRSKDGGEFEDVKKVKGAGTKQSESLYQEFDDHPLDGSAYYRLKQVDLGGKSTYSRIISIDSKLQSKYNVVVYPNPTDASNVNISLKRFDEEEEIMISVMDVFGKRVFEKITKVDASGDLSSSLPFPEKIAAGLYVVVVTSKNGSSTTKIIVR